MFLKKYGDLVLGIVFAVIAIAMYVGADALPPNLLGGVGSDFVPKIIAIGILILVVFQLKAGIAAIKNYKPEAETKEAEEDKPEYGRVFATIVVLTAYVFLMNTLGFMISSAIYLFLQILILTPKDKKNYILFAIIAVVASVAIYFIFKNCLSVMLPAGLLG